MWYLFGDALREVPRPYFVVRETHGYPEQGLLLAILPRNSTLNLKTILLPKLCKRDNLWRTCSSHHSLRIPGIVLRVQKRPFPQTYAQHVAARSQLEGDLKRFPSVLQSLIVALFVQFCAKSSSPLYRRCRVVPARNGLVKACALCRSVFLCRISRTGLDNLYWIHLTHTFLTSRTHAFRSPNPNLNSNSNPFDEVYCFQYKIKIVLKCGNLQAAVSSELSGNTFLLNLAFSGRDE
jgi:hypothetical protein